MEIGGATDGAKVGPHGTPGEKGTRRATSGELGKETSAAGMTSPCPSAIAMRPMHTSPTTNRTYKTKGIRGRQSQRGQKSKRWVRAREGQSEGGDIERR
jgi:hypothetical protein